MIARVVGVEPATPTRSFTSCCTPLLLALLGLSGLVGSIAAIIVRLYRCFKILEAL
jgi:hypothetical protein